MVHPGTVPSNNVVCADLWGLPFSVGDRVHVFDGNTKSPTNGTWLRGRIYKLAGPKVGVHIEEGGYWEDSPKHMIPTRLVRFVDVENAMAVIRFGPNATAPEMARVTFSRESARPDEWIPMSNVFAPSDLNDARTLEKWIEVDRKLQEEDPSGLTELSPEAQLDLANDLEQAIRNEVGRKANRHDDRTHQWKLLRLSTSRLLHKHCIQPHDKLKKVVVSWRQNKGRIPLGNEAAAIADYWERFKCIKQLQMESIAEPELEHKELTQPARGNSYPSSLFPLHSHGFHQMNFPPQEHELKRFPIRLDEYPVGELPAQPPGACTKAGCDPENAGRFCFMDEVRRSEPPMWRKAAMLSDRCEEIQTKTEEERGLIQRQKWVERSKRAMMFNAHINFIPRYGVRTEHPIALSSYYEPTVLWRRDLMASIERRFKTVPVTAFYHKDYVFSVPYAVWALTSSPLRIDVQPKVPNLVVNAAAHSLDGRRLTLTSPVTLTITPQYITTSSKQAQQGSSVTMTIVPIASAEPSVPAGRGMLPGIEEVKEVPLIDVREESWKMWVDTCAKMKPLAPVAQILREVMYMDEKPHLWLQAIARLGDAVHLLRSIPMIRPVAYCENDITKFEEESAKRTELPSSKRGHTPDQERGTLPEAKKQKVYPATVRQTLAAPPASKLPDALPSSSPTLSRNHDPSPTAVPSPSPPSTPPAPSAPSRAAPSPSTRPKPALRPISSVARARTQETRLGNTPTPPVMEFLDNVRTPTEVVDYALRPPTGLGRNGSTTRAHVNNSGSPTGEPAGHSTSPEEHLDNALSIGGRAENARAPQEVSRIVGSARSPAGLKPRTVARASAPPISRIRVQPPSKRPLVASGAGGERHDSPDIARDRKTKRPSRDDRTSNDDDDPFTAVVSKAAPRARKKTEEDWPNATRESSNAQQDTDHGKWNRDSSQHNQWESASKKDDRWNDWQTSGWKDTDWKKKYSTEYNKKRNEWHR